MKKVLIFTSSGGGGHTAATKALTGYLEDEYTVESTLIFSEVLGPIDPGQIASFHFGTGEGVYNFCMRYKLNRVIQWMYKLGRWYFSATRKKNLSLIRAYLKQKEPDLVISVVPLMNNDILSVTQKMNIPFIMVPTDLDATTFLNGIEKPEYSKFLATQAFNDPKISRTFLPAELNEDQHAITGFPLRKDFFEVKDKAAIKNAYGVPLNKRVVMLLMGAVGSQETLSFTKELSKTNTPIHILICLGKNKKLEKVITQLSFPDHISYTIIGFTERISDLLAISDLFITKSGTVSFCEGLYMNVPMLLDATSSVLPWEQFNHQFLLDHGLGQIVQDKKSVSVLVDHLFSQGGPLNQMKKNSERLIKKNGCLEIKEISSNLIKQVTAPVECTSI